MRLLIQIDRQHEFNPELREIRTIELTETANLSAYHMKIMLMRIRYHARHEWDPAKNQIWWSLDPGYDNDLAVYEGRWDLFELTDQRTLGRFATRVDIGPGLPSFLQDFATRRKLPQAMESTRRWVDSGGTHRP